MLHSAIPLTLLAHHNFIHLSFAGICTSGGVILYDSHWHLGTFCGDGTYTLPVKQTFHLSTNILTIISYAVPAIDNIHFSYKLDVSSTTIGVINKCEISRAYILYAENFGLRFEMLRKKLYWYHHYQGQNTICNVSPKMYMGHSGTVEIKTTHLTHNVIIATTHRHLKISK